MLCNLKEHCFTDNELEDDFVGIRCLNKKLQICFPLGFDISDEKELRQDVKKLISVLLEYNNMYFKNNIFNTIDESFTSTLPLMAYKHVIEYFLSRGYYTENKVIYESNKKGKINFHKTIKKNKPIFQKNNSKTSLIYTKFQIKKKMISENELITAINKYCVYEAFNKLGFIYSSFMPYKFNLPENKDFCIYFLETKMHNTFDDSKKTLFDSMRNILIQNDKMLKESNFKFGTEKFYFVWEKMLDKAFGIKDKKDYFPKTQWKLNYPKGANSYPLQPDSIMIYANDVYVLDAKYYKYGITANARDLPPTSSIAKQIIYGEYVAKKESDKNIFNAFLMPYNKKKNPFGLDENYANIGYSFGEWRERKSSFEEIQGILIDTKFLFKNFDNQRESLKEKLREMINCNKNSIT